jgi:hypothetical protein
LSLSGCRSLQHPSRHEARQLKALTATSPILESQEVTLYRLPSAGDPARVAREVKGTAAAIEHWLGMPAELLEIGIAILSPDDPLARPWRAETNSNNGCAGRMYYHSNLLVVIGDPNSPRFWPVLRHEAAHAILHGIVGHHNIAFWFDEGVATLFESGVDGSLMPRPNPERLALAKYLVQTRHSLGLKRILYRDTPGSATGHSYARAWACVAYLLSQGIDLRPYALAVQQGMSNGTAIDQCLLREKLSLSELEAEVISWLASHTEPSGRHK